MIIKSFENVERLNLFAADKFVELATGSIAKRGRFIVALSGGSTPKKLYSLLAEEPFRSQIEWSKIHFFFGDERLVLPDDDQSNYRMVNEALFSKIEIPQANIHRFMTEEAAEFMTRDDPGGDLGRLDNLRNVAAEAALKLENEIRDVFQIKPAEFPRFDLIFLGMGVDGHTASLFPETEALKENTRIAVENYVPGFETFRLTFTFPTINHARNIIFLIAGKDKAETLREVLNGRFQPEKLPSQMIKPVDGELLILTDIEDF
jgi:6-phosphogluconolactonase